MSTPQWTDIQITEQDIQLDIAGLPTYVDDRASIAQDIKHMILDSGVLVELIAERDQSQWLHNTVKLEMMVEEDERIIPGTVVIVRDKVDTGKLWLTAKTQLGAIHYTLTTDEVLAL